HDAASTAIYTLSLHDALPISPDRLRSRRDILIFRHQRGQLGYQRGADTDESAWLAWRGHWVLYSNAGQQAAVVDSSGHAPAVDRSEEHTSELQSLTNLVCRLL